MGNKISSRILKKLKICLFLIYLLEVGIQYKSEEKKKQSDESHGQRPLGECMKEGENNY